MFSIVGAAVYILTSYKTNLFTEIFGDNFINDVKSKFLKKKKGGNRWKKV